MPKEKKGGYSDTVNQMKKKLIKLQIIAERDRSSIARRFSRLYSSQQLEPNAGTGCVRKGNRVVSSQTAAPPATPSDRPRHHNESRSTVPAAPSR